MLEKKLFQPNECHKVAVFGLGGMGKSRIALELANRMQLQCLSCSIFWVQATDPLTFENDYFEIGKKLRIPGLEDEKAEVKDLVKQRLSHESIQKWFMILDNADDEDIWGNRPDRNTDERSLAEYLPNSSWGSILITTRNRRVAAYLAGKELVELSEMVYEEAVDTLRNHLAKPEILTDIDATSKLVETLQYLPLAIVQAAAYININDETVQNYLDLLDDTEENIIELLSEDFEDQGRYRDVQNPVASTWMISFEQIRHSCPLAAEYLSFMSCLSEKNIPQSLLPDAPSKKKMTDAIGTLTGYSFLRKQGIHHAIDSLYDMHRLVRLVTRNWLRKHDRLPDWTKTATKRVSKFFPGGEHEDKDTWTLYMSHGQALCASEFNGDLEERYLLIENMANCLINDGKYNEAVGMHHSVVLWRETKFGKLHEDTLRAYLDLGTALCEQGSLLEAEKYLEQARKGYEETIRDSEDLEMLRIMGRLGTVYWRQGRLQEAEQLQVQVRKKRQETLGLEHPDTLKSMNDLALVYSLQGRSEEAEDLLMQVMKMKQSVSGLEHPQTLTSMHNLAQTYSSQGRYTEAEELYIQILEIKMRVLGTEHPDTLVSIGSLASSYLGQGRYEEAEELAIQVLEKRRSVLGTEHPNTLGTMNNLAISYLNQGRYEEAEELGTQILEKRRRVVGIAHPETLLCMNNLAFTLKYQGRRGEAISLMTECVQLSTTKLGADHPHTKGRIAALNVWMSEEQPFALDTEMD